MNDTLELDDLRLLDAALAGGLEPVAPPPALKTHILTAVRGVPQHSTLIREHEGRWKDLCPGVTVKTLSFDRDRGTATILMAFEPGAVCPAHDHRGPEQTFVVRGSCYIGPIGLRAGDFHSAEAGTHHGDVVSEEGCMLLLVVDQDDYLAA